jgi:histone H3/H4
MTNAWKVCSTCKKPIEFGAEHYLCSVSTCNRARTGLFFCSVGCWDAHVPMMRHRDAWAEQAQAPSRADWEAEQAREAARDASAQSAESPARRRIVGAESDDLPKDVLVVVSKLKSYVRARSGMNTSDSVTGPLSDHIRKICDRAIANAERDGRKTVLDRDIPKPE